MVVAGNYRSKKFLDQLDKFYIGIWPGVLSENERMVSRLDLYSDIHGQNINSRNSPVHVYLPAQNKMAEKPTTCPVCTDDSKGLIPIPCCRYGCCKKCLEKISENNINNEVTCPQCQQKHKVRYNRFVISTSRYKLAVYSTCILLYWYNHTWHCTH